MLMYLLLNQHVYTYMTYTHIPGDIDHTYVIYKCKVKWPDCSETMRPADIVVVVVAVAVVVLVVVGLTSSDEMALK